MATYNKNQDFTLDELIRREFDKDLLRVAEVLVEENMILQDLPMFESNDYLSHTSNMRVSEGSGGRTRRLNRGVNPSATSTERNNDVIEMLEDWSDIDEEILKRSSNQNGQRALESRGILAGISKTMATRYVYGNNATDKDQMTGLAPRMNTIDSKFVVNAGGSGADVTSLYIIQPGIGKVYGVYPRGGEAGLFRQDWGRRIKETAADGSTRLVVWSEQFKAHFGLVVEDPNCMGRVANIETAGATNLFNFEDVIDVLTEMKDGGEGSIIYGNKTLFKQIKKAALNRNNVNLGLDNVFGDGLMPTIDGRPVRMVEKIVDTETAIS